METVEVLVRIPKRDFEELQSNYVWWGKHGGYIKRGTVLPKGHGRLIDADTYRKEMLDSREFDFFKRLDMQPTIIEANKEAEDGNS